jgi:glycosyltransferase XagB
MGADGFFSLERKDCFRRGILRQPEPDPELADDAAMAFGRAFPGQSAMEAVHPQQAALMRQLCGAIGISCLLAPQLVVHLVMLISLVLFVAILTYRTCLVAFGCLLVKRDAAPPASDVLLPIYTILIALKDEAESAAQLSVSIGALDYPADRIDLKLLIETGDEATRNALLEQDWPDQTELLVLPPRLPRTKPRALNYGLAQARGTHVVVYDAEDRPDPKQLRAAVAAFAHGASNLACVQAPLVGVPQGAGWISAKWALEYAIQFGCLLPALA